MVMMAMTRRHGDDDGIQAVIMSDAEACHPSGWCCRTREGRQHEIIRAAFATATGLFLLYRDFCLGFGGS